VLLNDNHQEPLAGNLIDVEIVPVTSIFEPAVENITIQDAVKEAWQKRPELQQIALNLLNTGVEVKFWQNEPAPLLNAFDCSSLSASAGQNESSDQHATGALTRVFFAGIRVSA